MIDCSCKGNCPLAEFFSLWHQKLSTFDKSVLQKILVAREVAKVARGEGDHMGPNALNFADIESKLRIGYLYNPLRYS